ncbi:hypothetical protein BGX28_008323 [Mortierella sp. GBA30]|nr:hypothetical protein BGX28_008323 [Mortierella sp. GBA30]
MSSHAEASPSVDKTQSRETMAIDNPAPITVTASRPESLDTISQPLLPPPPLPPVSSSSSSSSLPPQELSLKQEESMGQQQGKLAHLYADNNNNKANNVVHAQDDEDHDSDIDSAAATEEDELNHEQEFHRQGDENDHKNNNNTNGHAKDTGTKNEDEGGGESSLSSDNDDEDEAVSGHPNDEEYSNIPEETLCRWKDCGKVLPSIAALVVHLSDEHIGWKKTSYTCEWQGCSRRPIAQTTRFALISHMRSHTKHKPYDCPVPECDKSFSRSDGYNDRHHFHLSHADSRLLRQLNLSSQQGGGAKSRKRLQEQDQGGNENNVNGYYDEDREVGNDHSQDRRGEEDEDAEDSDFAIENGQTPRERYGVLKAKFRYIHNERESLESEYEEMKKKLTRLRVERELLLDALLASQDEYQDPALQDIEDSE